MRTTASLILRALLGLSVRAAEHRQCWEPLLSRLQAPSGTAHCHSSCKPPVGPRAGAMLDIGSRQIPTRAWSALLQRAGSGCGRSHGSLRLGCLIRLDPAPPSKKSFISCLKYFQTVTAGLLPSNCFLVLLLAIKLQPLIISAIV